MGNSTTIVYYYTPTKGLLMSFGNSSFNLNVSFLNNSELVSLIRVSGKAVAFPFAQVFVGVGARWVVTFRLTPGNITFPTCVSPDYFGTR